MPSQHYMFVIFILQVDYFFKDYMDICAIQKLFNPDTIYLALCTSGLTPFENASLRSKYWHDINFIQLKVKSGNGYLKLSL